jgi:hypothetical protein
MIEIILLKNGCGGNKIPYSFNCRLEYFYYFLNFIAKKKLDCYLSHMHFKKFISLWALLALMLGQVTLAQHNASHIDHGFSQAVTSHGGQDEHQNDKDNKKHECPECLLTKSLQTAFYNVSVALSFTSEAEALVPQQQSLTIAVNLYKANSPRAPPTLLI